MKRSGVETVTVGVVALTLCHCLLAFLQCSAGPSGQEVLAAWRRQDGSLVKFVDVRVVSLSLSSVI